MTLRSIPTLAMLLVGAGCGGTRPAVQPPTPMRQAICPGPPSELAPAARLQPATPRTVVPGASAAVRLDLAGGSVYRVYSATAGHAFADVVLDARGQPALRDLDVGPGRPIGWSDGALLMYDAAAPLRCVYGPGVQGPAHAPAAASLHGLDPSEDAVRDHRVLAIELVGEYQDLVVPRGAVYVVDLETGVRQRVGVVDGSLTQMTAVPHPVLGVVWSDARGVAVGPVTFGALDDEPISGVVDVATNCATDGTWRERVACPSR